MPGTHVEHEGDPWSIEIPDHPQRAESPLYRQSRSLMVALVNKARAPWTFGTGPWQDHHGGGVWVAAKSGPRLYLLSLGMEWSAQWCADPLLVDEIRKEALDLIGGFPGTLNLYAQYGFSAALAADIVEQPITDAAGVARWCDGPYNASVPLPAGAHTGTLPAGAGYHHYPKPIVDISFFKHADFQLWVADHKGQPMAVVPVAPRGSGDGRIEVLYAPPGTHLHSEHLSAHARGERLLLPESHPLAQQAFAKQK